MNAVGYSHYWVRYLRNRLHHCPPKQIKNFLFGYTKYFIRNKTMPLNKMKYNEQVLQLIMFVQNFINGNWISENQILHRLSYHSLHCRNSDQSVCATGFILANFVSKYYVKITMENWKDSLLLQISESRRYIALNCCIYIYMILVWSRIMYI